MTYQKTIELYDDGIGCVQYVQHYGSDKMIVNAARVSFGTNNDLPLDARDEKLIKYLIDNKHTSTLEHCGITFKFVVPLFVRSQHHRHRVWAFNEASRRYTSDNIQFFAPKAFRTQHDKNRQASNTDAIDPALQGINDSEQSACEAVRAHHASALTLYTALLSAGVCREQARGVLPQNLYTEYYGTVNLNNLFKFVELRDSDHAQYEIQVVARAVKQIAADLFPVALCATQ